MNNEFAATINPCNILGYSELK